VEITGEYVILSFKEGNEQKIYGVYIFHDEAGTSTANAQQLNGELMKSLADHAGASRQAAEAAASAKITRHMNGHMQEAEDTIATQLADTTSAPGQQISLHQLFGQQRSSDAAFSIRHHDYGTSQPQPGYQPTPTVPQYQGGFEKQDVLGDLFRRAGLGAR
jgi:hypothetical protein